MLAKVLAIALNTYRENVRARLLHGLFALAMATAGYSLIVGAYAFKDTLRVVSDLGGASISLYGIMVAIILGATSLHRELELKTAFPILARPLPRAAYLGAKFLGSWLTLVVFVLANAGFLLLAIAILGGARPAWLFGCISVLAVSYAGCAVRYPRSRSYLPLLASIVLFTQGFFLAEVSPDDRRVLVGLTCLAVFEIAIVIAVANVFASFSSPFLTAMLTLGIVIVGRSADTLARLPERVFGTAICTAAKGIARVVPNLMVYVPPRQLLTGEMVHTHLTTYLLESSVMALGYVAVLLAVASFLFQRRDFT